MELSQMCQKLMELKAAEAEAVEARRAIEAEILNAAGIHEDMEGMKKIEGAEGFELKVTGRINRSVNDDLLQELARDNGLFDHLPQLFRWRPSINMKAWRDADESITAPLAAAITSKPGKPSLSIKQIDN